MIQTINKNTNQKSPGQRSNPDLNQHISYINIKKDTTLSNFIINNIFIWHVILFIAEMNDNHNSNGNDKKLVYLFLYNPMIYTQGWTTQSVHEKRRSAIEAMEEHKELVRQKWVEDFQTPEEQQEHPFGKFEDWRVTAMILHQ